MSLQTSIKQYALKPEQTDVCITMYFLAGVADPFCINCWCTGMSWGEECYKLFYENEPLNANSIAYSYACFENKYRVKLNMEELYYYLQLAYKMNTDLYECEQEIYDAWEVGLDHFRKACDIKGIYQDRLPAHVQIERGPR